MIDERVSVVEYHQLIQFVYTEHVEGLGKGRVTLKLTLSCKGKLAELLNALGYFSTRYERLLPIKHVRMNEL